MPTRDDVRLLIGQFSARGQAVLRDLGALDATHTAPSARQ